MESGIQSSFIPQDAASETRTPTQYSGSGGLSDLVLLIAVVLFVASLALGGAVFLYRQYVESSAASKLEQLRHANDAFEPALIHQITRLDDRMRSADLVLSSHIAPGAFFQALEQSTLETVAFQSLDVQATDTQHITVKFSGIAQSVNAIALQGDLFSKNGVITNPIFSDINRQADGVHFNMSAVLNPAAINYVQLVAGAAAAIQQQQVPQVQNNPASLFDTPAENTPTATTTNQ